MRVLLDTQCWLWMLAAPERFSADGMKVVGTAENELFVSAASAWEITIKYSLGKLRLPSRPAELIPNWMAESRALPLPIEHGHALHIGNLPPHHRDPFDRMLIAQAQIERLPILTSDRQFAAYDVELLWA